MIGERDRAWALVESRGKVIERRAYLEEYQTYEVSKLVRVDTEVELLEQPDWTRHVSFVQAGRELLDDLLLRSDTEAVVEGRNMVAVDEGRAITVRELADQAKVAEKTVKGWLAKMRRAGVLITDQRGPDSYVLYLAEFDWDSEPLKPRELGDHNPGRIKLKEPNLEKSGMILYPYSGVTEKPPFAPFVAVPAWAYDFFLEKGSSECRVLHELLKRADNEPYFDGGRFWWGIDGGRLLTMAEVAEWAGASERSAQRTISYLRKMNVLRATRTDGGAYYFLADRVDGEMEKENSG